MAIIYNKNDCNFKERKIIGNNFEMVCARGKITKLGIDKIVIVLGIYIEPRTGGSDCNVL